MSDPSHTRLQALKTRSAELSAGSVDPQKLASYLAAFDALDPSVQTAYAGRVDYQQSFDEIAKTLDVSPQVARELARQAGQSLSRSVLGDSVSHSESLTNFFEATTLDVDDDVKGKSFEERALRELLDIASVVAPHQPGKLGADLRTWGKFQILGLLDSGGFGSVYRAWDPDLQHTVALKLYHTHRSRSKEELLDEARKMARVSHPNVVVVHGAEEHDGRVGVWMELVEGQTLRDEIAYGSNLNETEATDIGIALCDALVAVNKAGLAHGDIKAQNVMRTPAGRVVLMDFGAARLQNPEIPESKNTLAGTKQYMAPELFDLAEPMEASDIYALGVLLFHLVTGKYPVRGQTGDEIHRAHLEGKGMLTLREAKPDLPEPFAVVVERALAKTPDQRWSTAAVMRDELAGLKPGAKPPLKARAIRLAAGVAAILVSVEALGFLATTSFEIALRLGPDFAAGLGAYFMVGLQGLLGFVAQWVVVSILLGLLFLIFKALRMIHAIDSRWKQGVAWFGELPSRVVATGILVIGAASWVLLTWWYYDLFATILTVFESDSLASVDTFMFSPEANRINGDHGRYSAYLSLALLFAFFKWFPTAKRTTVDGSVIRFTQWATLAVAFLVIASFTMPRRLVYERFEVVEHQGREAFVVGANDDELLLLAPHASDRTHDRVRQDDPELLRTGTRGRLFAKPEPQEALD